MSILLAPGIGGANLERFDAADVKAATDLTALFEHYTYGKGGKFACPLLDHNDATPSLSVFNGQDGGQGFRCHGCGWSGDALTAVQELERLEFPEAIQWLARWSNVAPSTGDYQPRPSPKPTAPKVRTLEPLEAEGDRLAEQGEWLEIFANERSLHPETLEALGVYAVRRGRWQRLRFPFRDGNGRTVSAQDRRLVDHDDRDKWLTAPGGTALFYNVSAFDHAEQWATEGTEGSLIVVEGVTDTIALLDRFGLDYPVAGVPGASTLGTSGSPPSDSAKWFINGAEPFTVLVIGDNDQAGRKFRARIAELHQGPLSHIFVPEPFNDVGEWVARAGDQFAEQWTDALAEGEDR